MPDGSPGDETASGDGGGSSETLDEVLSSDLGSSILGAL